MYAAITFTALSILLTGCGGGDGLPNPSALNATVSQISNATADKWAKDGVKSADSASVEDGVDKYSRVKSEKLARYRKRKEAEEDRGHDKEEGPEGASSPDEETTERNKPLKHEKQRRDKPIAEDTSSSSEEDTENPAVGRDRSAEGKPENEEREDTSGKDETTERNKPLKHEKQRRDRTSDEKSSSKEDVENPTAVEESVDDSSIEDSGNPGGSNAESPVSEETESSNGERALPRQHTGPRDIESTSKNHERPDGTVQSPVSHISPSSSSFLSRIRSHFW